MERGIDPGCIPCAGGEVDLLRGRLNLLACCVLACVQKSGRRGGGQVCQICGDGVGTTAEGDVFAACYVCGFPVCRPCYEYERKDGTQACPQCKTKYKRHKGKFLQPRLHSHSFHPASPDPSSGTIQLGKFGSLIKKNKNGGCF